MKRLEIERERVKERQREHGFTAPGRSKTLAPNLAQVSSETGRAIELAAQAVGIGKETLRKAVKIKEAAAEDPKIAEAWQKALEGQNYP